MPRCGAGGNSTSPEVTPAAGRRAGRARSPVVIPVIARAASRAILLALLLALLLAPAFAGHADDAPLATVAGFDLSRFLGRWYQIALIPNRFQAFCRGDTTAVYSLNAAGRIDVVNRCRDADGELQSAAGVARINRAFSDPARLEVRFAPAWLSWLSAVWGDYWVLDVDAAYHSMLVGAPDREYLWILAREPALDGERYAALLDRARDSGFDVSRIEVEPGVTLDRPSPPAPASATGEER